MLLRSSIMMVIGVILAGCSKPPGPEETAGRFYSLADTGRQEWGTGIQQQLWSLLSHESRSLFASCLPDNSDAVDGWESNIEAGGCLVLQGFDGQRREYDFTEIASGRVRTTLLVQSGPIRRYLELVNQQGWKIDVPATLERNRGQ